MNNILKRMAILCAVCMFQFTYAEECNVSSAGPSDFDTDGNGVLDGFNAYANNGSITARIYDDAGNDVGDAGDYLLVYHEDELRGVGLADLVPSFLGNGYKVDIIDKPGKSGYPEAVETLLGDPRAVIFRQIETSTLLKVKGWDVENLSLVKSCLILLICLA